jgi:adenylate cyclase
MSSEDGRRLAAATVRRLMLVGWLAAVAGTAVVFMAIGFLIPVFFDAGQTGELGRENVPIAIGTLLVLGAAVSLYLRRVQTRALRWVADGREPDAAEHRAVMTLAARGALANTAGWGAAAVIDGLLNLHHGAGFAAVITSGIWLGGETTSALVYLLSERTLRPVTALALESRPPERSSALGVRTRLMFAWSLGTGVPILGILVVGIVGITKSGVDAAYVGAAGVFLAGVATVTGLTLTLITARAIAAPISSVRRALDAVREGDLSAEVPIDDASEIGLLQAGFNRMADGLRDRERIRDLFGRQVGRDVAHAALDGGVRLGGEERQIGALFVDLIGSTSMALAMPPSEVVRLLNKFFRVVVEVVDGAGGLVNKFEGDAALCVFGAPVASNDPAGEALQAGRELAVRLERDVPEVGFAIGVSAGAAVAGNVGAEERFEYTVIGDPVNEAARLCDLAKERGELVLASGAAIDRSSAERAGEWTLGDSTVLRGRLEATRLARPRDPDAVRAGSER